MISVSRSQWQSVIRRESAAIRLLGLGFRFPPGPLMFVLCVVSKDQKAKCRTMKTQKQSRIKYKQSTREYTPENSARVVGVSSF